MFALSLLILLLLEVCYISGIPGPKDGTSSEELNTKLPPTEFSSSSSWGFDSLTNFLSKTNEELNAQISELTKSAKNVANQASAVTESTKVYVTNRSLMGRVYGALRKIPPKERTIQLMVDSFATAIAKEFHDWMPLKMILPDLEMKVKLKYLCGTSGYISNMKTMKFMKSDFGEVNPEDKKIDVIITFSFQSLHMLYDHFGESTFMTRHVAGTLDLAFRENEVSFGMDIPNVSIFDSIDLTPECLISIKNFTVNHLGSPSALIEPASAFRTFAEHVVNLFAKKHEEEFKNIFRLGVMKSLRELIQSESKWICKTPALEDIAKAEEKNVLKPIDTDKFEKYCGKKTQTKDKEGTDKTKLINDKPKISKEKTQGQDEISTSDES